MAQHKYPNSGLLKKGAPDSQPGGDSKPGLLEDGWFAYPDIGICVIAVDGKCTDLLRLMVASNYANYSNIEELQMQLTSLVDEYDGFEDHVVEELKKELWGPNEDTRTQVDQRLKHVKRLDSCVENLLWKLAVKYFENIRCHIASDKTICEKIETAIKAKKVNDVDYTTKQRLVKLVSESKSAMDTLRSACIEETQSSTSHTSLANRMPSLSDDEEFLWILAVRYFENIRCHIIASDKTICERIEKAIKAKKVNDVDYTTKQKLVKLVSTSKSIMDMLRRSEIQTIIGNIRIRSTSRLIDLVQSQEKQYTLHYVPPQCESKMMKCLARLCNKRNKIVHFSIDIAAQRTLGFKDVTEKKAFRKDYEEFMNLIDLKELYMIEGSQVVAKKDELLKPFVTSEDLVKAITAYYNRMTDTRLDHEEIKRLQSELKKLQAELVHKEKKIDDANKEVIRISTNAKDKLSLIIKHIPTDAKELAEGEEQSVTQIVESVKKDIDALGTSVRNITYIPSDQAADDGKAVS